jgi:hypothetical protein
VNRTDHDAADDTAPGWSPDGSKIAFVRSNQVWVMNANGTGQTQLTSGGGGQPAWSPDGTKIAFSGSVDFKTGIAVMDADGTDPANVDSNSGGTNPSWSPDGTKIAFAGGGDIYFANANGSGSPTPVVTDGDHPAWSPDGEKIAFESSRDGYWEIFTANVDGTGLDNVTENDALEYDDNRPDWGGDTVAPTVTITTPPDGASYARGQSVTADYACSDASSGVATCAGPVADGAPLDTTSAGAQTFNVISTDNGGNTTLVTHGYTVRPDTTDTDAPVLDARAKRRQKAGRKIRVKLTSDEGALALAGGKVVVKPPPSSGSAALKRTRRFKLKSIRTALVADETTLFKLRPKGSRRKSRRTRRKIRRLVLDGNRAKARVKLSATDAAGNEATKKIKIRLVR